MGGEQVAGVAHEAHRDESEGWGDRHLHHWSFRPHA
jgi:hypothetical protein